MQKSQIKKCPSQMIILIKKNMKKLMYFVLVFFAQILFGQVVQLVDSKTKEIVSFSKIPALPVGAKIDNIIYASKNGTIYKRVFSSAVDARWFGASSENSDNLIPIQNAINTGFDVYLGNKNDRYKIAGTLNLKSNQKIYADGARVQQMGVSVPIFDVVNKSNIEIKGISFFGKGDDYTFTSSSLSVGVSAYGVDGLKVENCDFALFTYASVSGLRLVKNFVFNNNTVTGFELAYLQNGYKKDNNGVSVGGQNITITNNKFSGTSQGITIAENSRGVLISNNTIFNIWLEHGMYIDAGVSDLKILGNYIKNVACNGLKVQNANYSGYISENVIISNNIVDTTGEGGDGILVNNTASIPSLYCINLVVSGNILNNIYQSGINVRFAKNVNISQNIITNSLNYGIYMKDLTDANIVGNSIKQISKSAIYSEGNGLNYNIVQNVINGYGLLGEELQGNSSAITILKPSNLFLSNNIVNGGGSGAYAFFNLGTENNQVIMQNNVFRGFKYSAIRLIDSAPVLVDVGNVKN